MTPREAGIQAFYADESTTNTLQGLNAAFDAYEKERFDHSAFDHKDAEFIVRAVNAHDDLVKALEAVLAVHGEGYSWCPAARAAISKAKEA